MTIDDISNLDPINTTAVEGLAALPAFDDLFAAIVSDDLDEFAPREADAVAHPAPARFGRRPRSALRIGGIAVVVGAVLVLALGLVLTGGHSPSHRTRTGRTVATRSFGPVNNASMTWHLVGDVAGAGWEQNSTGPPPGTLTSASVTACYAVAGQYASPRGGAPLLGESFYTSSDFGRTWSVLPMPKGFAQSSALNCPSVQSCAIAGVENDKPVLVETTDAGQTWTAAAVEGDGSIQLLSCSSTLDCSGVIQAGHLAPDGFAYRTDGAGVQETIVTTTDGGVTWTRYPFPTGDVVSGLACPTAGHCVVVGTTFAGAATASSGTGFAMTTVDSGAHWKTGSLPAGIFANGQASIACATERACMAVVSQDVPAAAQQCDVTPPSTPPPPGGIMGCSTPPTVESAVVATTDAGVSWHVRPLPDDVPLPQLDDISCADATTCWITGSDSVPLTIGNVHDEGSPLIIGTADDGATWTAASFDIPADAPNYLGQAYISIGSISCPSASSCLALGAGAQSAPSVPLYRYGEG